jgi:hypothetical protein
MSVRVRDALLDRLDRWPYVRVQRRGDVAIVRSRAADAPIGRLDLRTGVLDVEACPVRCDSILLRDADSLAAAEALLRWRLDLDFYAGQERDAL